MFGKIKQGDPVRVRKANGEVVDAVYIKPFPQLEKSHVVKIGTVPHLALGGKYARRAFLLPIECRFVGPTPKVIKGEQR